MRPRNASEKMDTHAHVETHVDIRIHAHLHSTQIHTHTHTHIQTHKQIGTFTLIHEILIPIITTTIITITATTITIIGCLSIRLTPSSGPNYYVTIFIDNKGRNKTLK